ncbi:hypothetical protein MVEN_01872700 [Mycena venus]|uniref:DUF6534 domain-containing protein n=1 Tax=Mycena venus TaxID=2733690 RepID=A0A8H6XIY9_9AGAR|nr:hypothetical protein MVEN_01872700 [Mycena venus]
MSQPVSSIVSARHSPIPLDNILGAWFIGLVISSVIFGVTCLQVYLYYTKYCSRDKLFLKSFVGVLMFFDTVHLSLLSMSYYEVSVTNFGDFIALAKAPWSLVVSIIMHFCEANLFRDPQAQILVGGRSHQFVAPALTDLFLDLLSIQVQLRVYFYEIFGHSDVPYPSFYAFRVWVLSNKSIWMPSLIAVCATTEVALGIGYMNNAFRVEFYSESKSDIPYSTSSLAFEVACDVLIAGCTTLLLVRNKTSFHKTNRAINTLVAYTINTGALTTLFAICGLVTWFTSTLTLIYAPFATVLSGINGLLTLFSARFFFIAVRLYGCSFMSM